jgi:hypothetical protein
LNFPEDAADQAVVADRPLLVSDHADRVPGSPRPDIRARERPAVLDLVAVHDEVIEVTRMSGSAVWNP